MSNVSNGRVPLVSIVTSPTTEPVSLDEAKLFLKVDNSSDDTLINSMIIAARQSAESYLTKSLISQTRKITFDDYAPSDIALPFGPVTAVVSVTLFSRDGTQNVINGSYYYLTAGNEVLVTDTRLLSHRVEVVYSAGYGVASAVPGAIKQGMLAHIATLYDGRSAALPVPDMALMLYRPYRNVRL
jgi:uncharacterized phiE125 gp8 family phage protein